MEMIYKITGLDCPNCTARIEKVISKIDGVKSASINFMTGKTIIKVKNDDGTLGERIESAVKKAEPKASIVKM